MTQLQHVTPQLPAPTRVGQATAVEQSRAVAEVQAAIVVAQQCPRDLQAALSAMRESCKQQALAKRAFYRFPRAGQTVTGPSVYLARELARCWGNVQYGISELRRDDEAGQSEMQAWAWDVQTNTRNASTFVVPHKRDTKSGPSNLIDMRDIYENNANNGARRVREAILAILPPWFVEEAKELCSKAIEGGGGQPLAQRIAEAIGAFEGMGVTATQIAQKLGRPSADWTAYDVAQLEVIFNSLRRGEVSKDDEFPPVRVTSAEVAGDAPANGSGEQPKNGDRPITKPQLGKIGALMTEAGLTDRDAALAYVNEVLARPEDNPVGSRNELTAREAGQVIDALEREAAHAAAGESKQEAMA